MNPRLAAFVELVVGRRDPTGIIVRSILGVALPAVLLFYGLRCVVMRRAMVPARGTTEILGLSAVSAGAAYALLAIAAYIYICWNDHPRFHGLRDITLQILLVATALVLTVTFGLAFF